MQTIVYSLFFYIYLIFNCNFHSLYMLLLSTRYGSLHTGTASLVTCVKSFCMLHTDAFGTTYVQNCYFAGICSENHYLKMHLAPHMCKTITLKANDKEIVTLKCIWQHICAKPLL